MADVQISYTTVVDRPRNGPVGATLRWVGNHPVLAGLVGGLGAVGIAAGRAFDGVQQAPVVALILSGLVVVVWMVLCFAMRHFFARQAISRIQVRRDIEADPTQFCWRQDGEQRIHIDAPSYRLVTAPQSDDPSDDQADNNANTDRANPPRPVWLIVSGPDERFVLKTKVTSDEAAHYDHADDALVDHTDETLPTTVASPLLSLADRQPN